MAGGDLLGVCVDRLLVERVDDGGLGATARGAHGVGDRIELRLRPAGEVDRRALACEGAGHRAADRSAAAVDDGIASFEQHVRPPRQGGHEPRDIVEHEGWKPARTLPRSA